MSLFGFFSKKEKKRDDGTIYNPDKILFEDEHGNTISNADLEDATGEYDLENRSHWELPDDAIIFQQQGLKLLQEENYDNAITKYEEAHRLAPDWPQPPFDLTVAHLLQDDIENAYRYFLLADTLEPRGFFNVKIACWALEKEVNGTFPKGLFLTYYEITQEEEATKKVEMAESILEQFPNYTPAWADIAKSSTNVEHRFEAIAKGLSLQPDPQTKGSLLINQALMLAFQEDTSAAINILGNLILAPKTTAFDLESARCILKQIAAKM